MRWEVTVCASRVISCLVSPLLCPDCEYKRPDDGMEAWDEKIQAVWVGNRADSGAAGKLISAIRYCSLVTNLKWNMTEMEFMTWGLFETEQRSHTRPAHSNHPLSVKSTHPSNVLRRLQFEWRPLLAWLSIYKPLNSESDTRMNFLYPQRIDSAALLSTRLVQNSLITLICTVRLRSAG